DSSVPLIPQLAGYLIAAGGKRIRPLLTLACAELYGAGKPETQRLAAAVEFIHTATLLHDDVVDESPERRGQDAANLVFGNQASVLVGDFLFSRAFQLMVESGSLDALRILSNASAIISEGEVMQLGAIGRMDLPEDHYLKIIESKTAALFSAACEVGPALAGATPAQTAFMASFGLNLGIAFQIADDALDYDADREKLGKAVGDDFREGKVTAPVLLALRAANGEERTFWTRTLAERNQNEQDLERAQDILKKHEAVKRSLDMAEDYGRRALEALSAAPDHPVKNMLAEIVPYAIARES
ncbi:MAG: polyprenyl synthetase family protein, partial [Alphaproteobacteria bacterium]|nr:polyprenyl synthetase family protein [Alphaproteobacteria bacterium]